MKTNTDAYYYYANKLKFHDAKTFCESALEGEIFPSTANVVVARRLQMMKTVRIYHHVFLMGRVITPSGTVL